MPDYANGKIYKITSGDLTYIGSTCEPTLARRLAGHVRGYRQWKNGKYGETSSFQVFETGNYEISLLELYPCNSKDELTARERFYIETNDCVNKRIEGRTRKERYEANRTEVAKKFKEYYEDNKTELTEKAKERYEANKPEITEKVKAYYEANKAEKLKYAKAYREANKEKIAEKQKAYYEANKT